MSNLQSQIKRYPLLPFSQLIWDEMQMMPTIYRDKISLVIDLSTIEVVRLQDSIEKALRNHPVFSIIITDQGEQYFQPSNNILKGQFHSIKYQIKGNNLIILFEFNRILGDSYSFRLLFQDIFRAYSGKTLFEDKYLDFLYRYEQLKNTSQYKNDRQWYEENFGQVNYSVRPNVDTNQPLSQFGEEATFVDDLTDVKPQLLRICDQYQLSTSQYISLSGILAIMDYNGTDSAALTWAYIGRETMDEMAIFGSLHRDIPVKIIKKENSQKQDLLEQIQSQMKHSIAHSLYPYTLLAPQNDLWNYAVNVLTSISEKRLTQYTPIPVQLSIDNNRKAMSLLDIDVCDDGDLIIVYRYSATHYKESSIRRFAALVRKYAEWLLQ